MYKQQNTLKSWQGLHRFCFRFIFVPFYGILFWGVQDSTALSWIQNGLFIVWWDTVQEQILFHTQILFMAHGTVQWKPSGSVPLHLGQEKCLPEAPASTEELPNTGNWASLSPAASTTSVWCSSVSISEFNGEFQLLPSSGMDLPLSLLLQLGCC